MTNIRFTQRLPKAGPVRHSPSDTVVVVRGQRTIEADGTVLLQGRIVIALVDGIGEGTIEPTKLGEYVEVFYKHRDPYSKKVQIPNSGSLVVDTSLTEIQ